MFRIAICDDDQEYVERLKYYIWKTGLLDEGQVQFCCFYSGEELFMQQELHFDLVILDMQMERMDGYVTAIKLRKQDKHFLLVFCSGVVQPSNRDFRANVYRYLSKDYTEAEMVLEMAEIVEEMKGRKQLPFFMCNIGSSKEIIRLYPESIIYISIRYVGCEVFPVKEIKSLYSGQFFRLGMNINEAEQIFTEKVGFVRVHNSHLINMAYIIKATSTQIELIDETRLTISRSRLKGFQRTFAAYMAAKYKG